jgi:hypothetical protein
MAKLFPARGSRTAAPPSDFPFMAGVTKLMADSFGRWKCHSILTNPPLEIGTNLPGCFPTGVGANSSTMTSAVRDTENIARAGINYHF